MFNNFIQWHYFHKRPFNFHNTIYFILGPNLFKCTKILSHRHLFVSFLPSFFLLCKDTFVDDYDGIYNCNGSKYSPFEKFDNFWLIIFYGDQNIG
jgi:hypothetical protein